MLKVRKSPQTALVLRELLAEAREWRYGYDLSRGTGLKSGTLYPLLIRLSDQGYLEARWAEPEREGRPARHEYRLTDAGMALALEQVAAEIGQPEESEGTVKGVVLA